MQYLVYLRNYFKKHCAGEKLAVNKPQQIFYCMLFRDF